MRKSLIFGAIAGVLLLTLAGCPRGSQPGTVTFDPDADLFSPEPSVDTTRRTMECTARAPDGTCLQNKCTESSEGDIQDCASFAAACVNAGEHWSGTKAGGVCTMVL